ncbi:MAG: glycosyltransferase family 1 protein [Armatimonadia bacterium]
MGPDATARGTSPGVMRVAMDARALIGGGGGLRRYTAELMRGLLALDVDLSAWIAGWHLGELQAELEDELGRQSLNLPVALAKAPGKVLYTHLGWPLLSYWQRLLPFPLKLPDNIDLFHAIHWPIPVRRRPPTVLTIHDLIGLTNPEWVPPFVTALHRAIADLAPLAAQVIVDSEATRAEVLKQSRVEPERITVVPLGVRSETFSREVGAGELAEIKARYQVTRPYFLAISSIEPRKNLTTLLKAYDLLCERGFDGWDLHLIGSRVGHTPDFEAALASPRRGVVRVSAQVPDTDMIGLLQGADAFVFISRAEGFGLPVLEAFAAGCPAIAADATSLPEVAGEAALLVDPLDPQAVADAMLRLATEPALAEQLRDRGRARVQEFTWERTARETLEVYRKALA